ncbi:hypothetical protein HPB50_007297 [Hyalomma asiaticum]|uniref:Uncharacterized protein n=1 Tax=Hyalomma asiaticum TaxID=266040 RepID=A0ACB7RND3_HYAAI|nr:hypothetical protein HPB50_007297 [Hyalomma asiaticum]
MGDKRSWFKYRVCGFGPHVEQRTVEFQETLHSMQVCSWCGVVPGKPYHLSCTHMICEECFRYAEKAHVTSCLIDKKEFECKASCALLSEALGTKTVRCMNVDKGCGYTGRLMQLNRHLSGSCTLYLLECSKCGENIAYKDFVNHFKNCEGAVGVVIRAADGSSLLDDIRNASKELEQALASTSAEVRHAVGSFTEHLESLHRQLAASSEG